MVGRFNSRRLLLPVQQQRQPGVCVGAANLIGHNTQTQRTHAHGLMVAGSVQSQAIHIYIHAQEV